MLHVIAIILSLLFIVILVVIVIIFIIINNRTISSRNKNNTRDNRNIENTTRNIDRSANRTIKKKRHRSSRSESKRESKTKGDKEENEVSSNILDICNYSRYTIYLMIDGTLHIEDESVRIVKSDLNVNAIISFSGYLYAIANKRLYMLDNNTIDNNTWKWNKVTWSPDNVIEFSVPYDDSCIWIRCNNRGYLYDKEGNQIDSISTPHKRVYGIDKNNYIIINNGKGVLQPNNQVIEDVRDAVITHEGELYTLSVKDRKHKMIKIVNWKPYYII